MVTEELLFRRPQLLLSKGQLPFVVLRPVKVKTPGELRSTVTALAATGRDAAIAADSSTAAAFEFILICGPHNVMCTGEDQLRIELQL